MVMKTKNYRSGTIIDNMDDLLAEKSVFVKKWNRISPVAFLRNWQAHRLHRWMKKGEFKYVVEK